MDNPDTNTEGNTEEMTARRVSAILAGDAETTTDDQIGQLADFLTAQAVENDTTPLEEAHDMGLHDPELETRITQALEEKTKSQA